MMLVFANQVVNHCSMRFLIKILMLRVPDHMRFLDLTSEQLNAFLSFFARSLSLSFPSLDPLSQLRVGPFYPIHPDP